jgi:hypothetical protein
LQEAPEIVTANDGKEMSKTHRKRMCNRLMMDTERSAELEGNYPGIHTIYFLEDFAREWMEHALELLQFIGLDPKSKHSLAGIKSKPVLTKFDDTVKKERTSPWMHILENCHKNLAKP